MDKLGIDVKLLLTQIVNFTIMLVILTKLLYKPILTALKDRKKKIAEGLAFAEKAKLEEEKMQKRQEEMLKDTRDEARVILENAKKEGKKLKDELLMEGKKEAEVQKKRMEQELEAKFERMQNDLLGKTVDIAAEMVKRLIPSLLNEESQHKLIISQLQKLEKSHVERS